VREVAVVLLLAACKSEDCRVAEQSPDRRFSIVVCREAMMFSMPGGASDAPGDVRLVDRRGRILERAGIEMVQLYEGAEWEPTRVYIRNVSDGWWQLPDD
jgi:hypothetical protein